MSYIGKEPQYTDFPSKFFNGDGTAMTVTLDYAPPNLASLLVFIDGVRQDTSAYTISGYNLTFTGVVPSGTNNVQVVHMGMARDVNVPALDSVATASIQDDAVTSAKLDTNITIDGNLTVSTDALIDGDLKFDSGYGSTAIAYGCRAWVFFEGTGTVSIYKSGNVSSITDNGVGNFTINFATAMYDSNYVSAALFTNTGTNYTRGPGGAYITGQTASQFTVLTCYGSDATTNGGLIDKLYNQFSFFR